MIVSVVVPTYRRVQSLEQCLHGLRAQVRQPDEVLVIARSDDDQTLRMLEKNWHDWEVLKVVSQSPQGGAVGQLNRGLEESRGDVICFTDDDAIPRPEWLLWIERHFEANDRLAGVGGPDYVVENGTPLRGDARLVGVVQWFGRIVGNHHLGSKVHAHVDMLKGVNMSFRAKAVGDGRFETQLRGEGAQVCSDMAFSLALRKKGWQILFDAAVAVDHYPARRFDSNQRWTPSMRAVEDSSFNYLLSIRRHMRAGLQQRMALLWVWLIGTRGIPGVLRGLAARVRGDSQGLKRRQASKNAWRAAKQVAARG